MENPIYMFSSTPKLLALTGGGLLGGIIGGVGMESMISNSHPKLQGFFGGVGSTLGTFVGAYLSIEGVSLWRRFVTWLKAV